MKLQFRGFVTQSLLAPASFGTFGHHFSTFKTTLFDLGSLMRVQYPKCAYGPYCYLNPIKNGLSRSLLFKIHLFFISYVFTRGTLNSTTRILCAYKYLIIRVPPASR